VEKDLSEFLYAFFGEMNHIKINLISGNGLISFYLALILKKLSGIEITPDIEQKVKDEIVRQYQDFCTRAYDAEKVASHIEELRQKRGN
jgi:hypothetical protein